MTLTGHEKGVTTVVYSPDGSILASGGKDGTLRLWYSQSGELLKAHKTHTQSIYAIAFSPNGSLIACANNNEIHLWDMQNHELLLTYSGHTDVVDSLAYSTDGKTLASASRDGTVLLWDLSNVVTQSIPSPKNS